MSDYYRSIIVAGAKYVPASDLDRYRALAEGLYEALKEAGVDLWPGDANLRAREAMDRYEAATREPEGRSQPDNKED